MNEIKRLQQLAGIITEIKVNNPTLSPEAQEEFKFWKDLHTKEGLDNLYSGANEVESDITNRDINNYRDKIRSKYTGEDDMYIMDNEDIFYSKLTGTLSDEEGNYINEDVSDFNIGQSSETGGRRTTVTDIDPETQSVTWSVKKEVDDSTIHKDISDLISKFEKVQLKDFHSRPKLIQLIKDLKSIRNKFSRTVVKEDLRILKENLVGILKEIKVNQPGIKPTLSYNDAVKLDAMSRELFNYVNHTYSLEPRILRINLKNIQKLKSLSKKNNDPRIIELLNKYINYKNRFSIEKLEEIKVNNPNLININDLEIGKKYKFIFDEGTGLREKTGEVIEIDKNPQEGGELRIEIYSPGDKYEYEELYSDDIIKIINNS